MTTQTSEPRSESRALAVAPRQIWLIVIIGALSAFGPFSLDTYLPGLPALAADLRAATWQAQLTLSACLLGLALGQVIAGPLSDSIGRRRPLLIGLLLYALCSALCALTPSITILILLRFIQGLAGATGIVIARAIVRDYYSGADVARFFALTMIISGLAPILAPILGGQLLLLTSWRGIFVALAVIGVLLFALVWFGLGESLPPERRHTGGLGSTLRIFATFLRDRYFMGYALSSGLTFAAMFAYISGSSFVLESIYGISEQTFSLIFASNAMGLVIAGQIGGRLVARVSPYPLLAAGVAGSLLGGAVLLVAALGSLGLPFILLGFFLVVASTGLSGPNATALAMADQPNAAGSASALLGVVQYVIGALAGPLVGLGGNTSALPLALVIALLSLGALIVFVLLTRGRPTPAQG